MKKIILVLTILVFFSIIIGVWIFKSKSEGTPPSKVQMQFQFVLTGCDTVISTSKGKMTMTVTQYYQTKEK
jgi:uncharacterized protein YxeA